MSAYTDEEIFREAGLRMAAKRTQSPTPKVLRPCPRCGVEFGARELRKHKPKCRP